MLRVSSKWHFNEIKNAAILKLDDGLASDPARKIFVAKKYDVGEWLVPALNALAQQARLTQEDFDCLGRDWAPKLVEVREKYVRTCACPRIPFNACEGYGEEVPAGAGLPFPLNPEHAVRLVRRPGPTGRAAFDFKPEIRRIFGFS